MTVDAMIKQAIIEAVEEAEQPEALARRLVAWFDDAVKLGGEGNNGTSRHIGHIKVALSATLVKGGDGEGSD